MTTEQLRHLNTIVDHYGAEHQQKKAVEECKELVEEIEYALAGENNRKGIIDEIADVEIMIEQLKIIYSCKKEVESRINYKIERQIKRILGKYNLK